MALLSGAGGDDRLQIQLAVFGVVISVMVSALLPVLIPVNATGYSLDEIYQERASLEMYTGQSMVSQSPFILQHVYLPYTLGSQEYRLTEEGWLYGSELEDGNGNPSYVIGDQEQIGKTEIRLNPEFKSSVPLYASQTAYLTYTTVNQFDEMFGGGFWSRVAEGLLGFVTALSSPADLITLDNTVYYDKPGTDYYPTWNYTGYRYELDPMLRIQTHSAEGSAADYRTVDDAKLSIVWYDTDGQEGISGGLVLYNNRTNAILASYTAAEIVAQYNAMSQTAAKFRLDFDGTLVNMWIRFDADVLINNLDLSQSFSLGKWTVAFTAASADTYLDLQNSNSFTNSLGSMLETYIGIFTLDLPQLSAEWNLALWILCVMPMGLAMILFLSRFGLAGLGAGILGAAFAAGVML